MHFAIIIATWNACFIGIYCIHSTIPFAIHRYLQWSINVNDVKKKKCCQLYLSSFHAVFCLFCVYLNHRVRPINFKFCSHLSFAFVYMEPFVYQCSITIIKQKKNQCCFLKFVFFVYVNCMCDAVSCDVAQYIQCPASTFLKTHFAKYSQYSIFHWTLLPENGGHERAGEKNGTNYYLLALCVYVLVRSSSLSPGHMYTSLYLGENKNKFFFAAQT